MLNTQLNGFFDTLCTVLLEKTGYLFHDTVFQKLINFCSLLEGNCDFTHFLNFLIEIGDFYLFFFNDVKWKSFFEFYVEIDGSSFLQIGWNQGFGAFN